MPMPCLSTMQTGACLLSREAARENARPGSSALLAGICSVSYLRHCRNRGWLGDLGLVPGCEHSWVSSLCHTGSSLACPEPALGARAGLAEPASLPGTEPVEDQCYFYSAEEITEIVK